MRKFNISSSVNLLIAMEVEIHRLEEENKSLSVDAERYRWIRKDTGGQADIFNKHQEIKMDEAIDQAISQENEQQEWEPRP